MLELFFCKKEVERDRGRIFLRKKEVKTTFKVRVPKTSRNIPLLCKYIPFNFATPKRVSKIQQQQQQQREAAAATIAPTSFSSPHPAFIAGITAETVAIFLFRKRLKTNRTYAKYKMNYSL